MRPALTRVCKIAHGSIFFAIFQGFVYLSEKTLNLFGRELPLRLPASV
jgi:hypothetical protein